MDKIMFYGTRGSCSLTSSKYMKFGGATTCVLLNLSNKHIMIDCGSGINNGIDDLKDVDELYLFISHSHLDHVVGIPTLLSKLEDKRIHIYGKSFNGVSVKESINKIMNQSLWPVRADTFKNVDFNEIIGDVVIDDITVKNMDSNHPGGCSLFRFECNNDIIVTAFDFCHLDGYEDKLINFAKGCSTLIYDGCLDENEIQLKATWGHSTPKEGAKIGSIIKAKETIITHYGIFDDDYLSNLEKEIQKEYPNTRFARPFESKDQLEKMVEIGALLSLEKNNDILISKIIETSMDITGADGGTLYLLENDRLEFKVMINKSKNSRLIRTDAPLNIPSVSINGKNACATSAREKKLINVENCYESEEYDFSGAKEYDKAYDYVTKSVMVIPLLSDDDDVVGVLQLINAIDKDGNIVAFKKKDEGYIRSFANQACMRIINERQTNQIKDLLEGFVKVMSIGIDERTPYNANHTRNMVRFAEKFFDFEEKENRPYKVDYKKKKEILLSIWLHDIGKILTPIEIMNKATRLGNLFKDINNRFERRKLLLKLALANKEIDDETYKSLEEERQAQYGFINLINNAGFLDEELKTRLDDLNLMTYIEEDGSTNKIISNEEYYNLSITKGTLTKEERSQMEGHVSMTQKFLSQLRFPKYYNKIPEYAGNHHEFLNGTGYPNHLTSKDLEWPCRLITICDIFEALISKDRPYKKPFSIEKASNILYEMVDKGQLDKDLVNEFIFSKCWEQQ